MKKIITVTGEVDTKDCGMVLSHEHLFIDLTNQAAPGAATAKITPADRPRLLCDPYCMRDNLLIDEISAANEEIQSLLAAGCNTIVDCSLREIGRDPLKLKKLAETSGARIIMGCGWYTGDTHPREIREASAEMLAEQLLNEINNGAEGTGIRPGIIGEIGTSKEITPSEWRSLEAAAVCQKASGLALMVHIYPWCSNGLDVTKFLTEKGVSPDRIVICHSDVTPDHTYIRQLLELGVWVELDNFGKEFTPAPGGFAAGIFVKDTERAALAAKIINDGFGSQLLLTNDICLKCMLRSCGGEGYTHIFNNILPLIAAEGIDLDYLEKEIMHTNPLAMLSGR